MYFPLVGDKVTVINKERFSYDRIGEIVEIDSTRNWPIVVIFPEAQTRHVYKREELEQKK